MVHIRKFLILTNIVKSFVIAPNYIRLVVFPFSLIGKAEDWLSDFLSRKTTNYDQYSLVFLKKFFPIAKFEKLIREVGNFALFEQELLFEAWE